MILVRYNTLPLLSTNDHGQRIRLPRRKLGEANDAANIEVRCFMSQGESYLMNWLIGRLPGSSPNLGRHRGIMLS